MKKIFLIIISLSFINLASAFDDFVINDIRIVGLQRVSTGSIFNVIPVSVGDRVDNRKVGDITRALFATEQFDDIQIGKELNTLIITVKERPSISAIDISGNKALKTEQLLESLEGVEISEGKVYKRSTLDKMKSELVRSYASQGRYGANVEVDEINKPRNRVDVNIVVDEGESATIQSINIIGNKLFSDDDLLRNFELGEGSILSFLTSDNQYSREKLKGDIENLESYYLDRGYLKYSLESTQVSLTRDKKGIHITYGILEGDKYTVSNVSVLGNIPIKPEAYETVIQTQKDQVYSQAAITQIEQFFTSVLGNEGYAFAEVKGTPEVDEDTKEVDLVFVVNAGKRTYTRKIIFAGNEITQDEVLRREMRQFEAAPTSDERIQNSKVRLERLGYFKEVNVETIPVPGTDDQVDTIYQVEEETTGQIGGNVGYSDFGLMLGFNLNERNFLGSGNTVGISINKSVYQEAYNLSFFDPYFTMDGVSRGYNIYFRETDYGEFNVANYLTNSEGIGLQFGYPISDTQRVGLNITYDKTDVDEGTLPAREITDFLTTEGNLFETLSLQAVWSRITLNRGTFPTDGASTNLMLMAALPFSDVQYARFNVQQKYYQPLGFYDLVFGFNGEIGYMDVYGDTKNTPFFQNFYAGGPRSLRGFESNTLGPRSTQPPCYEYDAVNDLCPALRDLDFDGVPDSPAYNPYMFNNRDQPIGGNVKVEGSLQLIFKLPMIEDQRSMRSAFFFDFGNVFSTNCRDSYGVGITWITGFGPMSFAIAKPSNAGPFERTEQFQFTIGNVF